MMSAVIFWVVFFLFFSLVYWKRKQELDTSGNPCLRFFGPRLFLPFVAVVFLITAVRNLSDPFHQKHPENSVVEFGFATVVLLASLAFAGYRITLDGRSIERHAWPLRPLRYSLDELEGIEKRGNVTVLRFGAGRQLKLSPLLSGQQAFLTRIQTRTASLSVAEG